MSWWGSWVAVRGGALPPVVDVAGAGDPREFTVEPAQVGVWQVFADPDRTVTDRTAVLEALSADGRELVCLAYDERVMSILAASAVDGVVRWIVRFDAARIEPARLSWAMGILGIDAADIDDEDPWSSPAYERVMEFIDTDPLSQSAGLVVAGSPPTQWDRLLAQTRLRSVAEANAQIGLYVDVPRELFVSVCGIDPLSHEVTETLTEGGGAEVTIRSAGSGPADLLDGEEDAVPDGFEVPTGLPLSVYDYADQAAWDAAVDRARATLADQQRRPFPW